MRSKKNTTTLPANVKKEDTAYPKDYKCALSYSELRDLNLETGHLLLYRTDKLGWVICTLHISNAKSTSSAAARYYGIGLDDGKIYTVGKGPHVKEELRVYLTKDNVDRLKPLLERHAKGLEDAHTIRDRISTRRARGAMYRAEGRNSWTW